MTNLLTRHRFGDNVPSTTEGTDVDPHSRMSRLQLADQAKAPLLGQIPIETIVREWGDKGTPVVQAAPSSSIARAFVEIGEKLVDAIEARAAEGEDAPAPIIDRSGGGGKRRLPVAK